MPDYKVIVDGLSEITEAQKIQTQGILKCIEANAIVTNSELSAIKDHLARQNHSIEKLWIDNEKGRKAVAEFRQHKEKDHPASKLLNWAQKRWYVVIIIFFVVELFLEILFSSIGIKTIVKQIWDKL